MMTQYHYEPGGGSPRMLVNADLSTAHNYKVEALHIDARGNRWFSTLDASALRPVEGEAVGLPAYLYTFADAASGLGTDNYTPQHEWKVYAPTLEAATAWLSEGFSGEALCVTDNPAEVPVYGAAIQVTLPF